MTDRISSFTVILKRPIRDDDAESILAAVRMVKGVADVVPLVDNGNEFAAEWRRDDEWRDALTSIVRNGPARSENP